MARPRLAGAPALRGRQGRPFRAGLVGAGYIAEFHAQALKRLPAVELVGVCDLDPGRAAAVQRRWEIPEAASSLAELLERVELDVVHVLAPPPLHAATAGAALDAGCHVFVEKPLAVSAAECAALRAAARRAGRLVGVNHNLLFQPAFCRLVRLIQTWRLGEVQHVAACWNVPLTQLQRRQYDHWQLQAPGNLILEQAVHPLSQVQLLLGGIGELSARAFGPRRLPNGRTIYDAWQLGLRCERGSAQIYLGWEKGFQDSWLHVVGEDGAAFVDLRRNTLRLSEKTRFAEPIDDLLDGLRGATSAGRQAIGGAARYARGLLARRPYGDPFSASMRGSIAAFYGALASGREPPVGLDDGAALVEVCERAIRAGLDCLPVDPSGER